MFEFKQLEINEFDEFSKMHPNCAFVQSGSMANLQQQQNRKVVCFGALQDKEIVAAGLFSIRNVIKKFSIAHCNQGPLIDYKNKELVKFFFHNVQKELKSYNCIHALITPNFEVYSRDENGDINSENNNLDIVSHLKSIGLKHLGYDNDLINGVGRWFFKKDLKDIKSEDDLFKSYDQNTRNAIRKAQKMNVDVVEINEDRFSEFKQLMEHTAQRRDFTDRNGEYYQSLFKNFNSDSIKCYLAQINPQKAIESLQQQKDEQKQELNEIEKHLSELPNSKKFIKKRNVVNELIQNLDKRIKETSQLLDKGNIVVLAGAIFIHHGNEVTYLFSGAYEEYFGYNAPYAIQLVAQKWAIEKEAEIFNFYGTQGKYANTQDEGVYHFKKGFGGYVFEQPGNFELEVNPVPNKMYHLIHKFRK